jgi:regulator of PEP synthase PpsR (kinase-PPPase family)
VVGLTLQPELLAEIRQRRVRDMRASARTYATLEEIYEELEYAERIHRRLGCPVIEVSTLAIEETAHRIIRLVEQRLAEQVERPRRKRRAS